MNIADHSRSRVWHGPALLESQRGDEDQRLLLVLGFHLDILRRPVLREDIHPASVSSGICAEALPDRLLHLDRPGHSMQSMGNLQRDIYVRSRQPFLERSRTRQMLEQACGQLFCSWCQCCDRLCHCHTATSTGWHSAYL